MKFAKFCIWTVSSVYGVSCVCICVHSLTSWWHLFNRLHQHVSSSYIHRVTWGWGDFWFMVLCFCYWPPYGKPCSIIKSARSHEPWKDNWTIYPVRSKLTTGSCHQCFLPWLLLHSIFGPARKDKLRVVKRSLPLIILSIHPPGCPSIIHVHGVKTKQLLVCIMIPTAVCGDILLFHVRLWPKLAVRLVMLFHSVCQMAPLVQCSLLAISKFLVKTV